MNYVIIESQTQNGTTAIVTPYVTDDRVEAEAVFLEKCAAARRSGLPVHAVTWLNQEGEKIAHKCFKA